MPLLFFTSRQLFFNRIRNEGDFYSSKMTLSNASFTSSGMTVYGSLMPRLQVVVRVCDLAIATTLVPFIALACVTAGGIVIELNGEKIATIV